MDDDVLVVIVCVNVTERVTDGSKEREPTRLCDVLERREADFVLHSLGESDAESFNESLVDLKSVAVSE